MELIIFIAGSLVWLFICLRLYRAFRMVAWLAGSTVVSCLFFLAVTVGASFFVSGALLLAPLWIGVVILLIAHLHAAQQEEELLAQSGDYMPSAINSSTETGNGGNQGIFI